MSQVPGERKIDVTMSGNGAGPAAPRYCASCGHAVVQSAPPERFGEVFCSETHAEEFVAGVRKARVATAAAVAQVAPTADVAPPAPGGGTEAMATEPAPVKPAGWRMALKMAACCGIPMLALVVLAGGGGALLGAAGAVLPLLALLACPLGMFFMMRGMMKGGQDDKRPPRNGER